MLLSEHTTIFLQNVCSHCGGVHSAPTTSQRPGTSKHGEKEEPGGSRSDFDQFLCATWERFGGFFTGGTVSQIANHQPINLFDRRLVSPNGGLGSGNLSQNDLDLGLGMIVICPDKSAP